MTIMLGPTIVAEFDRLSRERLRLKTEMDEAARKGSGP
jgi:hypothetical protein